jgi:perosamine synthetase
MKPRIHYAKPSITDLEVQYATDAAANGWGEKCYEYIYRFEAAFKAHLGIKYAIATSSCTGALHMGLAALGIRPGDEVILADSNWVATAAPIVHLGASPVFVDILPDTWCIDPIKVEKAITSRTKAIIAVHLYGNMCDMERLLNLSAKYKIPIVEDAAEALGSQYYGRRAGTIGLFGAFSFHGSKTLTTGEGGMFVTNDSALYERITILANHGRSPKQTKQFWPDVLGYKYKMSNVQAAIGCAQTERIDVLIDRKKAILQRYHQLLEGMTAISINPDSSDVINGAWMPTVVFTRESGVTREQLLKAFFAENIDARVFFYPLSSLPSFEDVPTNLHAWDIPRRAINLPSYHDMTNNDQERVAAVVKKLLS